MGRIGKARLVRGLRPRGSGNCRLDGHIDAQPQEIGAQGRFVVQMEPPAAPLAINQIHAWQVKLSMTGWWEIDLAIQSAEGSGTVVFNAIVGESGVKR